jgi:hypothetical protein
MTEEVQNTGAEVDTDALPLPDELSILKQRAKMMGITFSNNIGLESLRAKIAEAQAGETSAAVETSTAVVNPLEAAVSGTPVGTPVKPKTLRQQIVEENMRLIRLRIVNLDPKKKDLPGEFYTVANEYLGTVTKFIPYGEATDGGYHVPYCLYKMLRDKKFLSIRTKNDRNNANQIKVDQRWVSEFSLDILDPLTPDELQKLATAQTAAGNLG